MKYLYGLIILTSLIGCNTNTKYTNDYFLQDWSIVQKCSGLYTDIFPTIVVVKQLKKGFNGLYYPLSNKIELSNYTARRMRKVVQHEMLHYLLDQNNLDYTHKNKLFNLCVKGT